MKTNDESTITQEWEDMNIFSRKDLEWELGYTPIQQYEEKTSSEMFDH